MTLNAACQLWMEQRIDEELENQPQTGKSDRAIGREVSEEVATLFETVVSEDAIRKRAARRRGTFVPPSEFSPVTPRRPHGNIREIQCDG